MGLVKLPQINLYWSKDRAFGQSFPATVMRRNRFELLLRMIHFANNETADKSDRIFKIVPLINVLNDNFKKFYAPKETVCVSTQVKCHLERASFSGNITRVSAINMA